MSSKQDKFDELEEELKNRKQAILKKLNEVEKRKLNMIQMRNEKIEKGIQKVEENFENIHKNISKLNKAKKEMNKFVLDSQSERIVRAKLKEHSVSLNKLNAQ